MSIEKYQDIIDLPHPQSRKHPPMPCAERAAQFSPFAALSGHGDIIEETARNAFDKKEHEIIHTYTEGDEPWQNS